MPGVFYVAFLKVVKPLLFEVGYCVGAQAQPVEVWTVRLILQQAQKVEERECYFLPLWLKVICCFVVFSWVEAGKASEFCCFLLF